jgi:uncharacterized protein YdcH (DUF465 family)
LNASELGLKEFKQEAITLSADDFNSLLDTLNQLSEEVKNKPENKDKLNQVQKTVTDLKNQKTEVIPNPNGVKPIVPVQPVTNIPPIDNTQPVTPKAQEAYDVI